MAPMTMPAMAPLLRCTVFDSASVSVTLLVAMADWNASVVVGLMYVVRVSKVEEVTRKGADSPELVLMQVPDEAQYSLEEQHAVPH